MKKRSRLIKNCVVRLRGDYRGKEYGVRNK